MTRLELSDDLPARAAVMVRGDVDRLAGRLLDGCRVNAPGARVWITAHDERVRPTHDRADAQAIPDNLRFVLDQAGRTGIELARAPRDPSLSEANRLNCRCVDVEIPDAVAASFHRSDVEVLGPRARAEVWSDFPRVVESEFPSAGDGGGGWARRALDEVAAAHRGATARRT